MELVNTLAAAPGCCAICQESRTPAIDTQRHDGSGFRIYVCEACARVLGRLAGLAAPEEHGAWVRSIEQREAQAVAAGNALREREDALVNLEREHKALVRSVGYTLMKGAVVRQGQVALRLAPGVKKTDLPEIPG